MNVIKLCLSVKTPASIYFTQPQPASDNKIISLSGCRTIFIFHYHQLKRPSMNTHHEEQTIVQQQILMLKQDYETALQQGKEFEILKEIRKQINALEDVFC